MTISVHTELGLATATSISETIAGYSAREQFVENPGALGSQTFAQSFPPNTGGVIGSFSLHRLWTRIEFPAAAGESAVLRVFRFHKDTPTTGFTVIQITDAFTIDDSTDFSFTIDISSSIRDNFQFDRARDSIVTSIVYTAGGAPTMRALNFGFDLQLSTEDSDTAGTSELSAIWPAS